MFRTKVFYEVMDIVIVQLTSRFEGMNGIASKFSFLLPRHLIMLSNTKLIEKATSSFVCHGSPLSVISTPPLTLYSFSLIVPYLIANPNGFFSSESLAVLIAFSH